MATSLSDIGTLRQAGFGPEFDQRLQAQRGTIANQYTGAAGQAAANLGGSQGAALSGLIRAQGATAGERAAADMFADQQGLDLRAQELSLAAQQEMARQGEFGKSLSQRESEFARSLGLDRARLSEDARQYNQSLNQRESEFGRQLGFTGFESQQDRATQLAQSYLSALGAGEYEIPGMDDFNSILSALGYGGGGSSAGYNPSRSAGSGGSGSSGSSSGGSSSGGYQMPDVTDHPGYNPSAIIGGPVADRGNPWNDYGGQYYYRRGN